MNRLRHQIRKAGPPTASILILLILWQAFVRIFDIPMYLLPTPVDVLGGFIRNTALLFPNVKPTLYESITGFLVSIPVGVVLAVLGVWSRRMGKVVLPFLIFSQAVPKIAIAPLLLVWFGFGMTSKILIVFMMAFFPIFISTLSGLRAVDQEMVDMINCMRPSKLQVFMKLRVPNSLPFLADGLKLAIIRSLLGAVVSEWISSDAGLGYLTVYADAICDAPLLFATVALLSAIGFGFYMIVTALGRFMVPWYFAMRKTEIV